jgi:hypothetical protein
MLFYCALFVIIVIILIIDFNHIEFGYKLSFVILIFFSIFRFDVGADYSAYYNMLSHYNVTEIERMEPLSRLLIYISIWVKWPPAFFILFGLPTYLFIYYAIKKSNNIKSGFFIYLAFLWLASLDTTRQGLAVAITFYGFYYLRKKNILKYSLLCLLASLFHYSALICILFYPIYWYGSKSALAITTLCIVYLYKPILKLLVSHNIYATAILNYSNNVTGHKHMYFFIFLFIFILILYYNRNSLIPDSVARCLSIIYVSLLIYYIVEPVYAYRLTQYSIVLYCYIIPKIFLRYSTTIRVFAFLALSAYFFSLLAISNQQGVRRSPHIPYQTVFFQDGIPTFRGI